MNHTGSKKHKEPYTTRNSENTATVNQEQDWNKQELHTTLNDMQYNNLQIYT